MGRARFRGGRGQGTCGQDKGQECGREGSGWKGPARQWFHVEALDARLGRVSEQHGGSAQK